MAVLDWNENDDRDYTSISNYEDARRPRCRVGHENLVLKTNKFSEAVGTIFQRTYLKYRYYKCFVCTEILIWHYSYVIPFKYVCK